MYICIGIICEVLASACVQRPFSPCLVREKFSRKVLQYPSHRILRYVHGALNVDEKKLIAQFDWKLRDERFESN